MLYRWMAVHGTVTVDLPDNTPLMPRLLITMDPNRRFIPRKNLVQCPPFFLSIMHDLSSRGIRLWNWCYSRMMANLQTIRKSDNALPDFHPVIFYSVLATYNDFCGRLWYKSPALESQVLTSTVLRQDFPGPQIVFPPSQPLRLVKCRVATSEPVAF